MHLGLGNGGARLDVVGNATNTPSWVRYQASEHGYATSKADAMSLSIDYHSDNGNKVEYTVTLAGNEERRRRRRMAQGRGF